MPRYSFRPSGLLMKSFYRRKGILFLILSAINSLIANTMLPKPPSRAGLDRSKAVRGLMIWMLLWYRNWRRIKELRNRSLKTGIQAQYLFPGITQRMVQTAMRMVCMTARLRTRIPHDLRHTYATIGAHLSGLRPKTIGTSFDFHNRGIYGVIGFQEKGVNALIRS